MTVPAARRDGDAGVVEEDPALRALGRRTAGEGFRLHEVGERRHLVVHRLVELAVDPERGDEALGANRRTAVGVARDGTLS